MTQHEDEVLVFGRGEVKSLPHTLSQTEHLTLALLECSDTEGTAVFELRNPDAHPDAMVAGLISQNEQEVERTNRRRDRLHIPEKPLPVDTETTQTELIHTKQHQKLQIGDRLWVVTDISADHVTLTPGHDNEAHTLANTARDLEYGPAATAAEATANTLDESI